MNHFKAAFSRTMKNEGGYTFNSKDRGGETYMGISRRYWPGWPGWHLLDKHRGNPDLNADDFRRSGIDDLVEAFYLLNFWTRFQGEKLAAIAPDVSYEVFDSAVNMGVMTAVEFLQTALNMQREYARTYQELIIDGLLGSDTLTALDRYLLTEPGSIESNTKILLNCMNGEQYIHYKSNPRHAYFRGWFLRV